MDLLARLNEIDDAAVERLLRERDDLQRDLQFAFEQFHAANPGVYEALVALAREARSEGLERVGVGMLWELLRWRIIKGQTSSTDGYKLNNNHRSRYARLIMETEEDLAGVFETRSLRS